MLCLCMCRNCMAGLHCCKGECSRKPGDSLKTVEYDGEREREMDRDFAPLYEQD